MMKKSNTSQWLVVMATVVLVIINIPAYPEQFYYSFSGTITTFNDDNAGAIAAAGYQIGDPVIYTFIIDFDAEGFLLYPDGRKYFYADSGSYDYFTDFIQGDTLPPINGGLEGYDTETHWGVNADWPTDTGQVRGGTGNSSVMVEADQHVTDWTVGESFTASVGAFNSDGQSSMMFSQVELTEINLVATADPDDDGILNR